MKLVASGGVASKNTLVNTKGAVTLSLSYKFVVGINLNVAYTKDEVLVIIDNETLKFTTGGLGYITNATYNDLLHFNIGTQILHARIITLREVLDVYKNSNKILVLNLANQGDRTSKYIDDVLELINEYPSVNVYLKSFDPEVLALLKASKTHAKIGVIVRNDNLDEWDKDYDFYVINTNSITKEMIGDKFNNKKEVMTQLIQFPDDLINAYQIYGEEIVNEIYIITAFPMNLYETFIKLEKTNL